MCIVQLVLSFKRVDGVIFVFFMYSILGFAYFEYG